MRHFASIITDQSQKGSSNLMNLFTVLHIEHIIILLSVFNHKAKFLWTAIRRAEMRKLRYRARSMAVESYCSISLLVLIVGSHI